MMDMIPNVDSNNHTDSKARRSDRPREMETIDRGVGPTPAPTVDQRLPPYFGFSPYMLDRRSAMESGRVEII